jgi:hypothetical protein
VLLLRPFAFRHHQRGYLRAFLLFCVKTWLRIPKPASIVHHRLRLLAFPTQEFFVMGDIRLKDEIWHGSLPCLLVATACKTALGQNPKSAPRLSR